MVFLSSTSPRKYSMYVCKSTLKMIYSDFDKNVWTGTSAKGIVRLNRSQMSIILTYDVFGRALDTLMNLFGKRA